MKIVRWDEGSIAPLGLGLVLLSVGIMLTIVSATSLFIFQKRLTTLAEGASLFAIANFPEHGIASQEFIAKVGNLNFDNLRITEALLADNQTVEAYACATWQPPVISFGEMTALEICSHASARSGN